MFASCLRAAGRRLRHPGRARRGTRRTARRHCPRRWRARGTRAARRPCGRAAAIALRGGRRRRTPGRSHCAWWLRPPASLPSLRHRLAAAVRRPHRARRRSASFGRFCIRSGTSAWSSGIRCASWTNSRTWRATTPNSCLRCSTPARGGRRACCSIGWARCSTPPATHAYILQSLLALIDERHARFNATLYQLEPDVKEAPGALRDLMAARTIARVDRYAAPAARPRRSRAGSKRLRTSCCGSVRCCTSKRSAIRTCSATNCRSAPQTCSAIQATSRGSASSG